METRTVKLGDLSSDLKGQYGINASAVPLRTTLPTYLRITDIDDFGRIKHDGLCSVETDELNKYSLREGDLVFARTGNSTGRNYWYDSHDGSFVFAGFLIRFHFEETEELVPRFLKYYVQSTEYYDWIEGFSTGSTRKNLNARDYGNLPVVLPPKAYQQKVVAILDMIENKILLNQQINKNLLKLSVLGFNKWLDSTQSNQYTSLDKIASFKNGIAMQKFSPTDKIHVLPVIKIRELNQGYIDSNSDSVTSVIDDDVKVHNGDLVFSWSGTLSAKIWTDGDAALNQHLFKVTSNRWPKWFYYLWVLHHLNTFRGIAADKKTTMGHIKRKDLTNAKVLIPNAKEFKNLDTILNPIIEQMVNGGIESKNLIDIRNILLPKLLSGSMDLSSIEETINND